MLGAGALFHVQIPPRNLRRFWAFRFGVAVALFAAHLLEHLAQRVDLQLHFVGGFVEDFAVDD